MYRMNVYMDRTDWQRMSRMYRERETFAIGECTYDLERESVSCFMSRVRVLSETE